MRPAYPKAPPIAETWPQHRELVRRVDCSGSAAKAAEKTREAQ